MVVLVSTPKTPTQKEAPNALLKGTDVELQKSSKSAQPENKTLEEEKVTYNLNFNIETFC